MKRKPKTRWTFKCLKCGVRVSGIVRDDGRIYACDWRHNNPFEPERHCVCMECARKEREG